MEFRNNFQELKSQIEYLISLNKEDVTHIIKSSIYELESLKVFNEEDLNEINKAFNDFKKGKVLRPLIKL